jgi:rhamnogalacturonyl hydrolase YesR
MSATAALGYAALKGVRLGILDPILWITGERAVQAILSNIKETGIVDNVSSGTAGFIAYDDYNRIPIAPRLYGQALTLLLLTEHWYSVAKRGEIQTGAKSPIQDVESFPSFIRQRPSYSRIAGE